MSAPNPQANAAAAQPDAQPAIYETDIWAPLAADGLLHHLHKPMSAPDPLPEPEPELEATAPGAYWEEAHAAFHHCAAEDARIWVDPEADPDPLSGVTARECDAQVEAADLEPEAEPW